MRRERPVLAQAIRAFVLVLLAGLVLLGLKILLEHTLLA